MLLDGNGISLGRGSEGSVFGGVESGIASGFELLLVSVFVYACNGGVADGYPSAVGGGDARGLCRSGTLLSAKGTEYSLASYIAITSTSPNLSGATAQLGRVGMDGSDV